jgi:flagellar M-ring protein FliF
MPLHDFSIQLRTLLKNLTLGKKLALLAIIGVTFTSFVLLMMWTGKPDFQLLYSNLPPEDAGKILTSLKDQKIPYQISSNGSSMLIPKEKVYEVRLALASQGLPQGSGVGFEIFDNTRLGMTEFVQNVNYQRACQGELSRTINGFAEVESSRVHIVMPSKSLFVEEEKPATASVVLKIRPGRKLSKEQVQGIVHLVSSSVSGLEPENVTIVDNFGKMLAGFKGKSALEQVSSDQFEFQEKMEWSLEKKVKTMLEKALGPGKAIVRVSCYLDFMRREKTEEKYQPDNKVVRSEQLFSETSNRTETIPMGIPGTTSNMKNGNTMSAMASSNPEFNKQDRTVNYEIGKVTSHTVEPVGKLNRLSVAVVVDGTYNPVKSKTGRKKKDEWEYIPRTQDEMEKLEKIVKRTVNFDAKRGDQVEIANIPFETAKLKLKESEEGLVNEKESWLSNLKHYMPSIKHSVLGLFFLFSFLFIVRPLVRWLTSTSAGDAEMLKQLPMTIDQIERGYGEGIKSLPFRDQASQLIAKDSQNAVQLMRNEWLKKQ